MCLPSPKMPDFSAQIKAQQKALKEQKEAAAQKQRNTEMAAADEAKTTEKQDVADQV